MAAILGPGGPSMAAKIAVDGPGGPLTAGDRLRRDSTRARQTGPRKHLQEKQTS